MSTAIPAPSPEATPAAPAREIRKPLMWLLAILALGLVLRAMHIREGFQVEEFAAAAAVAERQGVPTPDVSGAAIAYTPTADNPLVAVAGPAEVSRRSVIPFGIQDPVPLYHYVLWGFTKVLPVADWSLRLPSLLAGLGCIVAVFWLCRRAFGTEMALVAALFVALDPIQIAASGLARPYTPGNLAAVLSFVALAGLLDSRKPAVGALWTLGYAVCVAVMGYVNGLLLLAVAAHLGMIGYALVKKGQGAALPAVMAVAGLIVGVVALVPEFSYWGQVYSYARGHQDYLKQLHPLHLLTLFWHNLAFFGGLLLILAAGAVVRMQLQGGGDGEKPEGDTAAPATDGGAGSYGGSAAVTAPAPAVAEAKPELVSQPLPENEGALWMGRFWLFLPQVVAIVLMYALDQSIYRTRFLSFTTLGAAILLAYYATRDASREVRLGVTGVVALALLGFGFLEKWSLGDGSLASNAGAKNIMVGQTSAGALPGTGMTQVWKDGDVVLMRPGLMESDFLRTDIPEANRPQVERAVLAPLTLLYPDSSHKPVIALTLSQYRNDKVKSTAGSQAPLADYYNADFAAALKHYNRYWMTGVAGDTPNTWWYLACVVPWMANSLDRGDLLLARERSDTAERYVTVKPGLGPDEPIKGLAPKGGSLDVEDLKTDDFKNFVHIVKPKEAKK
jgi:4-amino-4-deoxy-L-arabinose transferase-like glycosyltransferase